MKVLIIDNYDSFTFNLYQYVGEILSSLECGAHQVIVKRNDELSLEEIKSLEPTHIIISPGPGTPEDEAYFGVCSDVIIKLGVTIPTLGVCLGMQGVTYCFGGKIVCSPVPMHGKVSAIQHDGFGVYKGMPQGLEVMRYHSLMVDLASLPDCLEITAVVKSSNKTFASIFDAASAGCEIMGVRHKEYPIEGVQFHPESFATEGGQALIRNFLVDERCYK